LTLVFPVVSINAFARGPDEGEPRSAELLKGEHIMSISSRWAAVALSALALLAFSPLAAPQARADINLGDAANYAVIANVGSHGFHLSSDSGVTGNVGLLYTSSNPFQLSSGTITGNVNLQGTYTGTTGGTVTGSINQNVGQVMTDYNNLSTLSSNLGSSTVLASAPTITYSGSGPASINISNGYSYTDGSGNQAYVFQITANIFSNITSGFTINGSAGQTVVIDITGNNNVSFSTPFTLSSGLTADHVFLNILGSNQNVQFSGAGQNTTFTGDILAINDNINFNSITYDGRIFGGNANDFSIVSNAYVTQPAGSVSSVPEPSSMAMVLVIGGLSGVGYAWRRRRSK
jgi:PEP-CTERM motif